MVLNILCIILLVAVHLFAYHLEFLRGIPRSIWLSFAGGISIAYVFIQILPELAHFQTEVLNEMHLVWVEHPIYILTMFGLIVFYGLERWAKTNASLRNNDSYQDIKKDKRSFYIHLTGFCIYNAIIGYTLMADDQKSTQHTLTYTFAMGVHFIVNDHGLFDHYKKIYIWKGRWLTSASIALGSIAGMLLELPDAYMAILFSIVAGGVILNVLKEELPEERQSNVWAFIAGAIIYGLLLISM